MDGWTALLTRTAVTAPPDRAGTNLIVDALSVAQQLLAEGTRLVPELALGGKKTY